MLLVKLPSPPGLPPGVLPCPSEPSPPAVAKGRLKVATRGIPPPGGASAGAMATPATRPAARRAEAENDAAQREERPLL
jgi:hypothetical protein